MSGFVFDDNTRQKMQLHAPRCAQLMDALGWWLIFSTFYVTAVVLSTLVLYVSYKLCDESELYRTHDENYQYLISGIYLKSPEVASCMMMLYIILLSALVWGYSCIFCHASKESFARVRPSVRASAFFGLSEEVTVGSSLSPEWKRRLKRLGKAALRFCAIGLFAVLSFITNASYIIAKENIPPSQLVFIQLGILLFNVASMNLGIPVLLSRLYKATPVEHNQSTLATHVTRRAVYAGILSLINMLTPCIATLFTDDLCLHQYFVGSGNIF